LILCCLSVNSDGSNNVKSVAWYMKEIKNACLDDMTAGNCTLSTQYGFGVQEISCLYNMSVITATCDDALDHFAGTKCAKDMVRVVEASELKNDFTKGAAALLTYFQTGNGTTDPQMNSQCSTLIMDSAGYDCYEMSVQTCSETSSIVTCLSKNMNKLSKYVSCSLKLNPISAWLLSWEEAPTAAPTFSPTFAPTLSPTVAPTGSPTVSPTASPTGGPTMSPTVSPTASPTGGPTTSPTVSPTASPTASPTVTPTSAPTADVEEDETVLTEAQAEAWYYGLSTGEIPSYIDKIRASDFWEDYGTYVIIGSSVIGASMVLAIFSCIWKSCHGKARNTTVRSSKVTYL